ncbi:hypothetical protein B9T36_04150 [Acinetobacter sp. ANC 4204]|uniref:bifunctional helix-turn-helix transcriptional regulator/GNAT family N-acetyltransferase n=1 Tax=Acinetobacter sp. ANC 4204 TaxID=1977884 RepID=UPI000A33A5A3|nr:bifunctional helix-turn-helix transcriptional regulator/GNAT family N-acetyltransferase [Acinetobacter sp. ANC 4204]OTG59851.1 hypothetical protein B9T36_04150 [Acinetobacter sp. ANC 4204]
MSRTPISPIDHIRQSTQQLVREYGRLQNGLDQVLSSSSVQCLLCLEQQGQLSAVSLVEHLGLDKSSVSRMLAKLKQTGEIEEFSSSEDGRVKLVCLTEQGLSTVHHIHRADQSQISVALQNLDEHGQQLILQGLALYLETLKNFRISATTIHTTNIQIVSGYQTGCVARLIDMLRQFYRMNSTSHDVIEIQFARELADFIGRLDQARNEIWFALHQNRIVGCVAIDAENLGNANAQLRWLMVDDIWRGQGIGQRLMSHAMQFCELHDFQAVETWLEQPYQAAKKLYEQYGFVYMSEQPVEYFGQIFTEQYYIKRIKDHTAKRGRRKKV